MLRSRLYRNSTLVESDFALERLPELNVAADSFFWIDLVDPTEKDLRFIAAELNLNELAVEDAFRGRQRPKLEHYDTHFFINAYSAKFDHETLKLVTDEIAIFVTANALITVRDDEGFDINQLLKRWDDSVSLTDGRVAFLLWGLLDIIVDGYFEVVETLDGELEELEDLMFAETRLDRVIQRKSYDLRKALVLLRRVAVPMREVLNPIVKRDVQVIGPSMFAYFQDIYDHVMRVADWTDSLRDLVTTLLETNLTIQGNQMNLIMKKVTSWAAIIAVPTAITGWFGQNIPYLGFGNIWGLWMSIGSILVVSGILYFEFKRRDWL
jgi:magnesium transporter